MTASLFSKAKRTISAHILGCSCLCLMLFCALFLFAFLTLKLILIGCVLVALPFLIIWRKKCVARKFACTLCLTLAVLLLLALLVTLVSYNLWKEPVRKLAKDEKIVEMEGYIEEEIYAVSHASLYKMNIERLNKKRVFGVHVLVSFSPENAPGMYERLKGTAVLSVPDGTDPTFDTAAFYRSKGVFAQCDGTDMVYIGKSAHVPSRVLYTLRCALTDYISTHAEELPQAMIHALLLGDKSLMPDTLKRDLRTLGLSHLFAVSGLHLSILFAFVSFLLKRLRIGLKPRSVFMILFVILYMAICGFSVSVVRSGIMLIFYLVACLLDEKNSSVTSLLFSGALIVFFSPFSLLDCGFLMSFFATCGILFFSAYFSEKEAGYSEKRLFWRLLLNTLGASIAAQLAVIPVSLLVFGGFSVISPFATAICTPLLSLLLYSIPVLLLLFWVPGVSSALSSCFSLLCALFSSAVSLARYVKDLYVSISHPLVPILLIPLLIFAFVLFFKSRRRKRAWILVASYLLFSVIVVLPQHFGRPAALTSVNGKNDIFILCEGGKSCLVDLSDGSKKNLKISVDLLAKQIGDQTPDALLLTHYHQRHLQSLVYLCENFYPETLYLPRPIEENESELGLYKTLSQTAQKYGLHLVIYEPEDEIQCLEHISLSHIQRAYLKRSTHPALTFEILTAGRRISYFSSSASEIFTLKEENSVYFGVHGPVVKEQLKDGQKKAAALFATKDLALQYGEENGRICKHPTGLLDGLPENERQSTAVESSKAPESQTNSENTSTLEKFSDPKGLSISKRFLFQNVCESRRPVNFEYPTISRFSLFRDPPDC